MIENELVSAPMRAVLVAILLLGPTLSAWAADPHADVGAAKAHFAAGTSFYNDKRYKEAIDEFQKAYRLSHANDLLYNLGICYDALDDAGRATFYLRRYLDLNPQADERVPIDESLARLSTHVGMLIIHAPPHVTVTVDGIAVEAQPPTPLPMTAGDHQVRERRGQGTPVVVPVKVTVGGTEEVTLPELAALPPPESKAALAAAPRVDARSPTFRAAGIGLLVVGGAAVVGGIVGSALASQASGDVSHEETSGGTFEPSIERRGHDAVIASGVLYGVGGAALVAGTVLLLGVRTSESGRKVAVAPFAGPGRGGVLLGGRF